MRADIPMSKQFEGRVALVTGGSGGIGAAVCRKLADAGAAVAVGYFSGRERAQQLADELIRSGGRAVAVPGNVGDPIEVRTMVDRVRRELGSIDLLVSNAGRVQPMGLAGLDVEMWDRTMAEHVRAAFLLSQAVVPAMRERLWGRLLFVSSIAAFTGGFVGPHYAAAKAGLLGLMHSLAASFAPEGITANALAPALIDTAALGDAEQRARLVQRIPVGRFGSVDEVADLALAVLANGYLTGQTLLLDGGQRPD
jgi:3-oxoacyl-[acyl-carrier protein] reductase